MPEEVPLTQIESRLSSRVMPIPGLMPEATAPEPAPAPLPAPRPVWMSLVSVVVALLLAAVLFALAFGFYRKSNDFPVHYHPDERGKARQIATDARNFRHPQLLLETTQRAFEHIKEHKKEIHDGWANASTPAFAGGEPREHAVALMTGRSVSAAFAAIAVVALALVGFATGRIPGLIAAAVAVVLCGPLLVNAHYMKEDTALLVGLAIFVLASKLFWDVPLWDTLSLSLVLLGLLVGLAYYAGFARGWIPAAAFGAFAAFVLIAKALWNSPHVTQLPALILLGIGAGLAFSGKYVGVFAIVAIFALTVFANPRSWWAPLLRQMVAMGVAVAVVYFVNHRVFENTESWAAFLNELGKETKDGLDHHWGLTMNQPNWFFARTVVYESMMPILAGAALFVLLIPIRAIRRQQWGWDLFLLLFAGAYLLVISFCVIAQPRHVLPVVVLVHLMAGLAAVRLGQVVNGRWYMNFIVPGVFAAVTCAVLLPRARALTDAFANDSRGKLRAYIAANLPRNAVIAQDENAGLQGPGYPSDIALPQRVRNAKHAPMLGSIKSLRDRGVTHIALAETSYGRYFEPLIFPLAEVDAVTGNLTAESRRAQQDYQAHRGFYDEVRRDHELVWKSQPPPPGAAFLSPYIELYKLVDKKPAPAPPAGTGPVVDASASLN